MKINKKSSSFAMLFGKYRQKSNVEMKKYNSVILPNYNKCDNCKCNIKISKKKNRCIYYFGNLKFCHKCNLMLKNYEKYVESDFIWQSANRIYKINEKNKRCIGCMIHTNNYKGKYFFNDYCEDCFITEKRNQICNKHFGKIYKEFVVELEGINYKLPTPISYEKYLELKKNKKQD